MNKILQILGGKSGSHDFNVNRASTKHCANIHGGLKGSRFVAVGGQNDPFLADRRQKAFFDWRCNISLYLYSNRGHASRLAEFLGVSRPRITQWFVVHHRLVPGWVVMPTLEFLEKHAPAEAPKLIPVQFRGPAVEPSGAQLALFTRKELEAA